MLYSSSDSFSHKIWKCSLLTLIVAVGLLSIVGTGGGGGGGNGEEHGTLQFSSATYSGNEDAGAITVTVTRTGGSDGAATVDVSDASSGTATSGTDYTAITTTTLSWADGESTAKTVAVSVIADGAVEADETVDLALDNVTGATLGATTSTTVTILNDDTAGPGTLQFSVGNYSVAEGDGNATITVTRSGGDTGTVEVTYAASNGTAIDGSDFTAVSSTLSWNDGVSTAQTFQVPIIDDTDVEVPETVHLALSNPTGGATLGNPNTANLTITSEDKFGTIRFGATSYNVDEADGAVTNVITLERVDGSSGVVSVDVSDLGSGSATGSGTDYTFASPTTVSWINGDVADKYVAITIQDDSDPESTETVNLSLGNAMGGASVGSPSTTTVNIADNDSTAVPGELIFDSASYSFAEDGGSVTITVNRVNGASGAVGVSYATTDNTATAGSDYTASSGTLSWGDGIGGAQTFTVAITSDSDVENDETVTLSLTSPTGGATLGTPNVATLVITNDDTNLTMNIGDGTYWVAFQDGPSGSWTEWSPTSSNTYDFPVTDGSGRYGVAFHRQETNGTYTAEKTYVIQATLGELSSLNAFQNAPYTVSGTLSGYTGSNDSIFVAMHTKGYTRRPLVLPYLYSIARVPAGTRDLLAGELDSVIDQTGNFYLQRNINISGDLAGQDVDFATDGTAITVTQHNFVGSSAGQEFEVYYATNNGTSFEIMSDIYDGSTALSYPYLTNTEFGQAGDAYSFQIFKTLGGGTGAKYRIRNQSATTDPGDQSMGLGSLESLTISGTDSTQTWGLNYTPDASSFSGSPVFRGYQIDLDQTEPGRNGGAHWQIKISADWLGASTSYTYPSLSAVNDFVTSWALTAGTSTRTDISAVTSNNGTGLSLILRKTMGLNSNNIDPKSVTIAKKLAQNDGLKVDIAQAYYLRNW